MKQKVMITTMITAWVCLWFVTFCGAQTYRMTNTEQVAVPTATYIEFRPYSTDFANKQYIVTYRLLDVNGKAIPMPESMDVNRKWICRDRADENLACTAAGEPQACCTGLGTGTCPGALTCWTEVYGFEIKEAHIGDKTGKLLRRRLFNRAKAAILRAGNDAVITE